ncbi:unnamed protein product [Pleuronectes platessa]|uniref:Uncharacterized protein n=1 Tax=Pleuronectes platessa TaxID=8262 RepID=A0A9N7U3G5_PLEPL|nr:unnamed protein product [Pleuronectes platessa]
MPKGKMLNPNMASDGCTILIEKELHILQNPSSSLLSLPDRPFTSVNQLRSIHLFFSTFICSGFYLPTPLDLHCQPPPPQLQQLKNNLFCYHRSALFVFCTLGPPEANYNSA